MLRPDPSITALVVSDHGMTAMPTGLKYTKMKIVPTDDYGNIETIEIESPAEISCKLNLDFQIDSVNLEEGKNQRKAELANNNLHIWELAEVLKIIGEKTGLNYKLLTPEPVTSLFKDKNKEEALYGATSDINKANVIAAFNGPMAHVYLKGKDHWQNPSSERESGFLALVFKRLFQEGGLNLGDDILGKLEGKISRLLLSVDRILIRENGRYKVFKGIDNAGNPDTEELTVLSEPEYIKAPARITGMNHPQRSGDIILVMRDKVSESPEYRFTAGTACRSWHGSLNPSDSYVPFIVSYPGGNKYEISPIIDYTEGCTVTEGCDGNWRTTDLILEMLDWQYSQK